MMKVPRLVVVLVAAYLGGCAAAEQVAFALAPDQQRAGPVLGITPVQQDRGTERAPDGRPKRKNAKSPTLQPVTASAPEPILPSWTISAPKPSRALRFYSLTPSELFKRLSPSVYTVAALGSQGSAVAVSGRELVTTCHVVSRGRTVTLVNATTTLKADVVGADPATDRCFLRVQDGDLVPVPGLRDYSTLTVGEAVYTIGSPKGLANTLGAGLLSGLRTGDDETEYIQITAPLSAGSSGGGLFDDRGNLIGVTSFTIRDAQNLNFAIAASQFWR
jgi:S1-C subfamily serine protease